MKPELPATLSWYRDAANWVVGLSTGALAAAFAYREDIQAATQTPRVVFVAAAIAFLIALLAGIQYYFWITTYANQRERRDRLQSSLTSVPSEEQPAAQAHIADAAKRMERAEQRFGYFHTLLLWSFHFGVFGYATVTAVMFTRPNLPEESWELVTVPCCPAARCRIPQPHVLRIERTTGRTWFLTADSVRAGQWHSIPELGADTVAH